MAPQKNVDRASAGQMEPDIIDIRSGCNPCGVKASGWMVVCLGADKPKKYARTERLKGVSLVRYYQEQEAGGE